VVIIEPIRQVAHDGRREQHVKAWLEQRTDWRLFDTPRFYFTDFHINKLQSNGRENYIGDLEIKWLRSDSLTPAIFPFNKLQQMLIAPPYTDSPESFHRVLIRYTDGTAVIPVKELARITPEVHTRRDTNETDMVIKIDAAAYRQYLRPLVIPEP